MSIFLTSDSKCGCSNSFQPQDGLTFLFKACVRKRAFYVARSCPHVLMLFVGTCLTGLVRILPSGAELHSSTHLRLSSARFADKCVWVFFHICKRNTQRYFDITAQIPPQFTFHCPAQLMRLHEKVRSWELLCIRSLCSFELSSSLVSFSTCLKKPEEASRVQRLIPNVCPTQSIKESSDCPKNYESERPYMSSNVSSLFSTFPHTQLV